MMCYYLSEFDSSASLNWDLLVLRVRNNIFQAFIVQLFFVFRGYFRIWKSLTIYNRAHYSLAHLACSQGKKIQSLLNCSWVCIKLYLTPCALCWTAACVLWAEFEVSRESLMSWCWWLGWGTSYLAVRANIWPWLCKQSWQQELIWIWE